jgi:phycoerythrin-associated linker protein
VWGSPAPCIYNFDNLFLGIPQSKRTNILKRLLINILTMLIFSEINSSKTLESNDFQHKMLPPQAEKKLKCWIRSRHLICEGNFFIFETIDYSCVERFTACIVALGGSLISVETIDKIWMGDHRQVFLYRGKASLHIPCNQIKQYWFKYGGLYTRFDKRC